LGSKINVCCPLNSKPLYPDFPWVLNVLQGVSIGVLYNGQRTESSLPNKKIALIYTNETFKAVGFPCYDTLKCPQGQIALPEIINGQKACRTGYQLAYVNGLLRCQCTNSIINLPTTQEIISFCKKYNIEYVARLKGTEECRYHAFGQEGLKVTSGWIEKISTTPQQPPCCFCETVPPIR
jgi:hypothetical protein